MQQNSSMMPTPDELRRAENGDPWAALLVGLLRVVPSNNEMKLTRTEAFRFEDDSPDAPGAVPSDV